MPHSIYLFNPEHDMALAAFSPYYKPPADVVRMSADLSALPAWMAAAGDVVYMSEREKNIKWNCSEAASLLPKLRWTDRFLDMPYKPWGWNPALCATLAGNGVGASFFPSEERLKKMRCLSGRVCYVSLLSDLRQFPTTCGMAVACSSFEEVKSFLESFHQAVLKAPWSGSGRGVMKVSLSSLSDSMVGWINRIIRTQGHVMAEPLYDKMLDFAMEFFADEDGGISFVGYSLFETDAHGNYKSNMLLSDGQIESMLASYVPLSLLHQVRKRLLAYFRHSLPNVYIGYFGVDMMVCRQNRNFLLHPLVEVNLRMNMGAFSRLFFDRYCLPQACGCYAVEFFRGEGEASLFDEHMRNSFPLEVCDGRIASGYLSLAPVSMSTHYVAYIKIRT